MEFNNDGGKRPHVSRLKREMYASRLAHNPFGSPPSSSGSHGTVSTTTAELTVSDFSLSPPEAESTRKLDDDIQLPSHRSRSGRTGRFDSKPKAAYQFNTSLLHARFPEWSTTTSTTKEVPQPALAVPDDEARENIPPVYEDTQEQSNTLDFYPKRDRANMQPRVQDESECSTVLSHISPFRTQKQAATRGSRFAPAQQPARESPPSPRNQPSLHNMVSKIRSAQPTVKRQSAKHDAKAKSSASESAPHQQQTSPQPLRATPIHAPSTTKAAVSGLANTSALGASPTARSFFVPTLTHLPDWASGTLKFSIMKNGVPVFVKHGKARTQPPRGLDPHAEIDVLDLPEEEQNIFVSMDKLREEVVVLQEHDHMLQKEAERLEEEVNHLKSELHGSRMRRSTDSAIGSGSESEDHMHQRFHNEKKKHEEQLVALQNRLDQAQRQLGVHDIHSNALIAERDEALTQSHAAHTRARKLEAELESSQKDLQSTLQRRHDWDSVQLENKSLRAENEHLRQQHQSLAQESRSLRSENKALLAETEALRRANAGAKHALDAVRGDLATLQAEHAVCGKNGALELDYEAAIEAAEVQYHDNKTLRAKIELQQKNIVELKKHLAQRDQLIESLQTNGAQNTDASLQMHNAQLEAEVENLTNRLQHQQGELDRTRENTLRAMEIASDEVHDSSQELRAVNARYDSDKAKWVADTAKFGRRTQELERERAEAKQQVERRTAAIKKAKQLTKEITRLAELQPAKTGKATRIIEPAMAAEETMSEFSAKGSALNVDEDPTTQVSMTQGSDFASVFSDGEIPKLKQTVRALRQQNQQQNLGAAQTMEPGENPDHAAAMRRTKSDEGVTRNRSSSAAKAPTGILKKTSQFSERDDTTGQLSVRSGVSAMSARSERSVESTGTTRIHRATKSTSSVQPVGPRLPSRLHRRQQSLGKEMQAEQDDTEENMTSAFFMPDITLEQHVPASKEGPGLSKPARQVLDSLCEHSRQNCNVCLRVTAGTKRPSSSKSAVQQSRDGKQTIRVHKPIPVSERMPEVTGEYEDEPTMRPSQPPGQALAIVIKGLQDELEHLELQLAAKQKQYSQNDKTSGMRERKQLVTEIRRLVELCEIKSDQIYGLYDVLEGQKQAGQEMTEEELEVTIASIMTRASEVSWKGLSD